ncbi:MAG: T9SS type A sorting domain-containing protein [Taibaiella sp.]|nr:T9SS type A sorting domain-containing protein [Taibaiella sp.]
MKKFFTFLAIMGTIGAGEAAYAQSFTCAHDTVYVNASTDTNVYNNITVTGLSGINIQSKLMNISATSEMMTNISICDAGTCYGNADVWPNKTISSSYSPGTGDYHVVMEFSNVHPGGPWVFYVRLNNSAVATDTFVQTYIVTRTAGPVTSTPLTAKPNTEVSVYPNPASSSLNVVYDASADVKNIAVYNIIGKQVSLYRPTSFGSANLNIENIPSGVYFVRLINSHGDVVTTRRFTKQ